MNDPLTVRPGERRVVRLFALDMPPEQVRFLRDNPGAAADVLGVGALDADHIAILKVADLDEVGLAGYLADGSGVAPAEIEPDRAMLEGLTGHVMVVLSRAFGDAGATLAPGKGVRLIRTYGQLPTDWSAAPLDSDSARPGRPARIAPRKARADARRIGGMIFAGFMVGIALILWAVLT